MGTEENRDLSDSRNRVEGAYRQEKGRLLTRARAAGRSLEEAEDLVHDLYAEVMERLPLVPGIRNLPAWLNSLVGNRLIDEWRRDKARAAAGETSVAERTVREIIDEAGLDPEDEYVRSELVDALNDALRALPSEQRMVIEAQVFGGVGFRELAESTGIGIDTLMARKRYALKRLARALRRWIED